MRRYTADNSSRIVPGGVPRWVLGTSNSICFGRHFYSTSTIRSSVIAIVHAFFLRRALTNEELIETRTLLYQLMVFWSMRLDKRDVDGGFNYLALWSNFDAAGGLGAHIPDLSLEEEFFDVLYLGIFVVLSSAFDPRFYRKPPRNVQGEIAVAVDHFHSILHVFSLRFILLLDGEAVAHSYVVDRMLAEFAAAAVKFSRDSDESEEREGDDDDGISSSEFIGLIESILLESHPLVFSYYSACLVNGHKHFTWTGPKLQIFPRSQDILSVIPLLTSGEMLEFPAQKIYETRVDPVPPSEQTALPQIRKRRDRADSVDLEKDMTKKQKR